METGASSRAKTARVAMIGLSAEAQSLLQECFAQFGINTVDLNNNVIQRIKKERFEACALPLNQEAPPLLEAARSSEPNKRMVVYGVCESPQQAMSYSHYGINAVLLTSHFPGQTEKSALGDRQAIFKVVRATHLLVVHELRRYIRIPIVTDVTIESDGESFLAYSQEISAGGISVSGVSNLRAGQSLQLSFTLPDVPKVVVNATVSWLHDPDEVGIRFDMDDSRRLPVRDWVDRYLDMF